MEDSAQLFASSDTPEVSDKQKACIVVLKILIFTCGGLNIFLGVYNAYYYVLKQERYKIHGQI